MAEPGSTDAALASDSLARTRWNPADGTALVRVDDPGPGARRDGAAIAGLLEAGVTISCGVVPGWLRPATSRFLLEMGRRHGPLIEVHQHGYAHVDRRGGAAGKAEFGAF